MFSFLKKREERPMIGKCPKCGKKVSATESTFAKKVKCPGCGMISLWEVVGVNPKWQAEQEQKQRDELEKKRLAQEQLAEQKKQQEVQQRLEQEKFYRQQELMREEAKRRDKEMMDGIFNAFTNKTTAGVQIAINSKDSVAHTYDVSTNATSSNMQTNKAANGSAPNKKCPFCKEEILADAIKCKHCGSGQPQPPKPVERPFLEPVYFSILGVFILFCLYELITVAPHGSSGGGGVKTNQEVLEDFHREGRFTGYTNGDELRRDLENLKKARDDINEALPGLWGEIYLL